ncbi:putative iporin [Scophthalmus maximus]|uniref:Putative iporin n=1 Tax=Scophthalmus maximus TaxID=52904 RepID=A0A2U9BVH0_SCOMX|nr:putative iporin [Scophthalmus maximus]
MIPKMCRRYSDLDIKTSALKPFDPELIYFSCQITVSTVKRIVRQNVLLFRELTYIVHRDIIVIISHICITLTTASTSWTSPSTSLAALQSSAQRTESEHNHQRVTLAARLPPGTQALPQLLLQLRSHPPSSRRMDSPPKLSGETLIVHHIPLVHCQVSGGRQGGCGGGGCGGGGGGGSLKRSKAFSPPENLGLSRTTSLPERDVLQREALLYSSLIQTSSGAWSSHNRARERNGGGGRGGSTASDDSSFTSSNSEEQLITAHTLPRARPRSRNPLRHNPFLLNTEDDDDEEIEEEEEEDGDNLSGYLEDSSFHLHSDSNPALGGGLAPFRLHDLGFAPEPFLLHGSAGGGGRESLRAVASDLAGHLEDLDILGLDGQRRHGSSGSNMSMDCGEHDWGDDDEEDEDHPMRCGRSSKTGSYSSSSSTQHCSCCALSQNFPQHFPETFSEPFSVCQQGYGSDSSCNSSDGVLVNFSAIFNKMNNGVPEKPPAPGHANLNSSTDHSCTSSVSDPPGHRRASGGGAFYLDLHTSPTEPPPSQQQQPSCLGNAFPLLREPRLSTSSTCSCSAEHQGALDLDANCNSFHPPHSGSPGDLAACLQSQARLVVATQNYYKLVTCDISAQSSPSPAGSSVNSCSDEHSKGSPTPTQPSEYFLFRPRAEQEGVEEEDDDGESSRGDDDNEEDGEEEEEEEEEKKRNHQADGGAEAAPAVIEGQVYVNTSPPVVGRALIGGGAPAGSRPRSRSYDRNLDKSPSPRLGSLERMLSCPVRLSEGAAPGPLPPPPPRVTSFAEIARSKRRNGGAGGSPSLKAAADPLSSSTTHSHSSGDFSPIPERRAEVDSQSATPAPFARCYSHGSIERHLDGARETRAKAEGTSPTAVQTSWGVTVVPCAAPTARTVPNLLFLFKTQPAADDCSLRSCPPPLGLGPHVANDCSRARQHRFRENGAVTLSLHCDTLKHVFTSRYVNYIVRDHNVSVLTGSCPHTHTHTHTLGSALNSSGIRPGTFKSKHTGTGMSQKVSAVPFQGCVQTGVPTFILRIFKGKENPHYHRAPPPVETGLWNRSFILSQSSTKTKVCLARRPLHKHWDGYTIIMTRGLYFIHHQTSHQSSQGGGTVPASLKASLADDDAHRDDGADRREREGAFLFYIPSGSSGRLGGRVSGGVPPSIPPSIPPSLIMLLQQFDVAPCGQKTTPHPAQVTSVGRPQGDKQLAQHCRRKVIKENVFSCCHVLTLCLVSLSPSALVKAVNTAVDLIVAHFSTSRDPDVKAKLGNSWVSPNVGHLILKYLCPALHEVLQDGLKAHVLDLIIGQRRCQPWSLVEASTQLGPSTRVLHSLFLKVSQFSELTSHSMRMNAFTFGLLNLKSLEFWFNHLYTHEDIIAAHYHPWGFLPLSQGACQPLFEELLLLLQPLSLLPFDLDLLFEPHLLQRGQEHLRRKEQLCSAGQSADRSARSTFQLMRGWSATVSEMRGVGEERVKGVGQESQGEGEDGQEKDRRKRRDPAGEGRQLQERQAGWWYQLMQSSQVYIDQSTEKSKFVKTEKRKRSSERRQGQLPPTREGVVEGAESSHEGERHGSRKSEEGSGRAGRRPPWMGSPPESVLHQEREKTKPPEVTGTGARAAAQAESPSRGQSLRWGRLFGAGVGSPSGAEAAEQKTRSQKTRPPSGWLGLDGSVLDLVAQTIGAGGGKKAEPPATVAHNQNTHAPPTSTQQSTAGQQQSPWEVRALCHHVAGERGQLSFDKGDVLRVLSRADPDWLLCSLGAARGLVPIVYDQKQMDIMKERKKDSHPDIIVL